MVVLRERTVGWITQDGHQSGMRQRIVHTRSIGGTLEVGNNENGKDRNEYQMKLDKHASLGGDQLEGSGTE